LAFIDTLLAETLNKKEVMERVRQYFKSVERERGVSKNWGRGLRSMTREDTLLGD
jgi:hypothetical protein